MAKRQRFSELEEKIARTQPSVVKKIRSAKSAEYEDPDERDGMMRMEESPALYGGTDKDRLNYEHFLDAHMHSIAGARENLSLALSPMLSGSLRAEEIFSDVPVEREPPWYLHKEKQRSATAFLKTDNLKVRIAELASYRGVENHMKMTTLEWKKTKHTAYPMGTALTALPLIEWLEKHKLIDLWRVTYLRVTKVAQGYDLENTQWIATLLAEQTLLTPASIGLACFDFNLNETGDFVVRFCYVIGATSEEQERRGQNHGALAKQAPFDWAFAAENNTLGVLAEEKRVTLDRRDFYRLSRGVMREYNTSEGDAEEEEEKKIAELPRMLYGPTQLPITFAGYYYFTINPTEKSGARPVVVGTLDPFAVMRREGMTNNYSLLAVDDPFK